MRIHNRKQAAGTRGRQRKAIANKTYRCDACDVNCRDAASLRVHNETKRHITTVLYKRDKDKYFNCGTCPTLPRFRYLSDFKAHCKGVRHLGYLDWCLT